MKEQLEGEPEALLRRYSKLQVTLKDLCEALKVIEENAFTPRELDELSKGSGDLHRAIGSSSVADVTTYLKKSELVSTVLKSYESEKFKEDAKFFDSLVKYPVIASASLENLAFLHKSCVNMNAHATQIDKAVATNERLEFLGDSWVGALVSYILYKRYPYANEGALSRMRSAIVNNVNLVKWCKKVGFDQRLQANIPKRVNQVKDKASKYHADCFEAYVGALVVDRFSTEFKDVVEWIEKLSSDIFNEMGSQMVADPMNKNAKHELSSLLLHNKAGAQLVYHRLNSSSPFKIEVKLGDISLATGEGSSIREAEQRAAMKALLDTTKIKTYSLYELEDDISFTQPRVGLSLLKVSSQQVPAPVESDIDNSGENEASSEDQIELQAGKQNPSSSADRAWEEAGREREAHGSKNGLSVASEVADKSQKAGEGVSQAQVTDIVEQLLGSLRETVVSTVTTALRNGGIQPQPVVSEKASSKDSVVGKTGAATEHVSVQDIAAKVKAARSLSPEVGQHSSLEHPTQVHPAVTPTGRETQDIFAQSGPYSKTHSRSTVPFSVANSFRTATAHAPLSSQAQPSPAVTSSPQSSRADPHNALVPHLVQSRTPSASQNLAIREASQTDDGVESFTVDSSWKQKLYAFLGPRGCKPYYKTEAIGLQTFYSSCMIEGFSVVLGTGRASSKKQAEQIAAYHGLKSDHLQEFLANPSAFSVLNN